MMRFLQGLQETKINSHTRREKLASQLARLVGELKNCTVLYSQIGTGVSIISQSYVRPFSNRSLTFGFSTVLLAYLQVVQLILTPVVRLRQIIQPLRFFSFNDCTIFARFYLASQGLAVPVEALQYCRLSGMFHDSIATAHRQTSKTLKILLQLKSLNHFICGFREYAVMLLPF